MKKDDITFKGLVCNLCGLQLKDARKRLQYPAHACSKCYRKWKRAQA